MSKPDPAADLVAAARSVLLPDVLTVEDLARVLKVRLSAARAALRSGRIPGRRVGRRWLVSREELLRVLRPAVCGRAVAREERP